MFENLETAIISERRVSLTCTIKNILYVLIKKKYRFTDTAIFL